MNLSNNADNILSAIRLMLGVAKRECARDDLVGIRRQLIHEARQIELSIENNEQTPRKNNIVTTGKMM